MANCKLNLEVRDSTCELKPTTGCSPTSRFRIVEEKNRIKIQLGQQRPTTFYGNVQPDPSGKLFGKLIIRGATRI